MKKHFWTGLALLLPIIITIWIVGFMVNLLTHPFMGGVTSILEKLQVSHSNVRFLQSTEIILYIARILILVFLFFLIVSIGWLTQWYIVRKAIRLGDRILHRIPMVNKVYKATQDVMKTLFNKKTDNKTPVLVPFPHERAFTIGLATGRFSADRSPTGMEAISVLVLGTPNPSVGYVLIYPATEVKPLDMSVEEALKCIISCGSMQTYLRLKESHATYDPLLDHPQ